MPMIQGIDGTKLIEAFRAGRKDRLFVQEAELKRRKDESELATEEQYRGLAGQLIPRGGGVSSQYGVKGGGGLADQFVTGTPDRQPLQVGESNEPLLASSSPLPPRQRETVSALAAAVDGPGFLPRRPCRLPRLRTILRQRPKVRYKRSMPVTTRTSFAAWRCSSPKKERNLPSP